MPVSSPLSSLTPTGTIQTIQQDVIDALQGRTDISNAQIANYVAKTVWEITESNPFEELRTTGPNFQLTTGLSIYPTTLFLNAGDDYTFPESMGLYVDYPNNTVVTSIDYKTPRAIELMIAPATQGIPSRFTRYGSNFHLGPTPNAPYTVFLRYQVKHTFSTPPAITDPLYIDNAWFDIIAYGAAQRIAYIKRWTDMGKDIHDRLYGDPEYVSSGGKRGRPGLLAARLFQNERDSMFNTRQVGIVIPRYNAR
jgi:hypothetical protein